MVFFCIFLKCYYDEFFDLLIFEWVVRPKVDCDVKCRFPFSNIFFLSKMLTADYVTLFRQ